MLTELSKTFGTADNSIQLRKLELWSITDRNYAWIKGYLSNRLQHIQIDENYKTEYSSEMWNIATLQFGTTTIVIIC